MGLVCMLSEADVYILNSFLSVLMLLGRVSTAFECSFMICFCFCMVLTTTSLLVFVLVILSGTRCDGMMLMVCLLLVCMVVVIVFIIDIWLLLDMSEWPVVVSRVLILCVRLR